ncbi:WD domain repeat-containing protein 55 [Actinomortierella wolfii]|nr:WD domain repeat-containing protein 55 [Actinomortierella wolfii]
MPKKHEEPETLVYKSTVFDFAFHPTQDIIATGLITGHINCVKYAPGQGNNEVMWSIRPSKKSVRGLAFSHDGAGLFTVTKDGSIGALDVSTGNVLIKKSEAHEAPINTVRLLTETVLATGDDNGVIKLWDVRTGNETMAYSDNVDFISDMDYDPASKTLVASSGQGTVSVYDIRKPKMLDMSATQDDELLSICIVKDRRKVLAGSQEGILNIYSWGDWGDCTDRFIGHPNSIDTICKIDEDTVVTGSSDGLIRVIDILPNKFQGVVGEHEDYPIECLRLSHDRTYLASSSHDDTVRFWDVRYLTTERGEDDEDDDSEEAKDKAGDNEDSGDDEGEEEENDKTTKPSAEPAAVSSSSNSTSSTGVKRKELSDSSNEDSDEEPKKKNANNNRRPKKAAPPKENPNFFDDL